MVDAVGGEQPPAVLPKELFFVRVAHAERVDVVRRDPGDVAVDRLVGELDRLDVRRTADARHVDGELGDVNCLVNAQVDTAGEAPGAVVHDAHGEADVLAVQRHLEVVVS